MRMRDISNQLLRKLERLDRGQGDRGPWCMCNGRLNGGELLTVSAADHLCGDGPETVCRRCEKPLLLMIVIADGDEGAAELAELRVREDN